MGKTCVRHVFSVVVDFMVARVMRLSEQAAHHQLYGPTMRMWKVPPISASALNGQLGWYRYVFGELRLGQAFLARTIHPYYEIFNNSVFCKRIERDVSDR